MGSWKMVIRRNILWPRNPQEEQLGAHNKGKYHMGASGGNLVENMGLESQNGFNTLILVKNDITKCSRELFIQLKNLPLAIIGRL